MSQISKHRLQERNAKIINVNKVLYGYTLHNKFTMKTWNCLSLITIDFLSSFAGKSTRCSKNATEMVAFLKWEDLTLQVSAFDARWKYWGKSEVSSFYISTEIRRAPIASLLIWQDHLTKVDIALLTTPKLERQKRNVFSFITDLPVLLEELSGCSEITVPSQYLGLGVLLLNCSNCS